MSFRDREQSKVNGERTEQKEVKMNKALILLMFVLLFLVVSCGGEDTEGKFKPSDCTGEFPNYHKGLCWSNASSKSMDWDNAITYCENLGGRLPTISEIGRAHV